MLARLEVKSSLSATSPLFRNSETSVSPKYRSFGFESLLDCKRSAWTLSSAKALHELYLRAKYLKWKAEQQQDVKAQDP